MGFILEKFLEVALEYYPEQELKSKTALMDTAIRSWAQLPQNQLCTATLISSLVPFSDFIPTLPIVSHHIDQNSNLIHSIIWVE